MLAYAKFWQCVHLGLIIHSKMYACRSSVCIPKHAQAIFLVLGMSVSMCVCTCCRPGLPWKQSKGPPRKPAVCTPRAVPSAPGDCCPSCIQYPVFAVLGHSTALLACCSSLQRQIQHPFCKVEKQSLLACQAASCSTAQTLKSQPWKSTMEAVSVLGQSVACAHPAHF